MIHGKLVGQNVRNEIDGLKHDMVIIPNLPLKLSRHAKIIYLIQK